MPKKIIIIEDDQSKARAISDLLENEFNISGVPIARSYQSGVKSLRANNFDLVLLDMTMNTFDVGKNETGGKPKAFAGKHVLDQMDRLGLQFPVIVVTGFETFGHGSELMNLDQLDIQLRDKYPNNYLMKIYYHASETSWKINLVSAIRNLFPEL